MSLAEKFSAHPLSDEDVEAIRRQWRKDVDNAFSNAEITVAQIRAAAARKTLEEDVEAWKAGAIETTCKHITDEPEEP